MSRSHLCRLICGVLYGLFLVGTDRTHAQEVPPKVTLAGLEFSNDSSLALTGGQKARVFDVTTGKKLREFDGVSYPLAFSPASRSVCAVGGEGLGVHIWDVTKPNPIRELSAIHGKAAFSGEFRDYHCAIDKSGRFIARGYARYNKFNFPPQLDEGRFRLSDIETGKDVQTVDVTGGGVQGVAFSGDGKLVAFYRNMNAKGSTVEVYRVRPWEAVASVTLPTRKLKGESFGTSMRFVAGSPRLLVAGGLLEDSGPGEFKGTRGYLERGLLWVVDLSEKPSATLLGEPRGNERYASLSVSPDGKRFVTEGGRPESGAQRRIEMRELITGKLVWKEDRGYNQHCNETISPDGKHVGITSGSDIVLFDAETGKLVRKIDASK